MRLRYQAKQGYYESPVSLYIRLCALSEVPNGLVRKIGVESRLFNDLHRYLVENGSIERTANAWELVSEAHQPWSSLRLSSWSVSSPKEDKPWPPERADEDARKWWELAGFNSF